MRLGGEGGMLILLQTPVTSRKPKHVTKRDASIFQDCFGSSDIIEKRGSIASLLYSIDDHEKRRTKHTEDPDPGT